MALDERTLRFLAAQRMSPDAAERYASRPGAGGYVNPDRPTLARVLQDLGGIGGPRVLIPGIGGGGQTINVNAGSPPPPAGAAKPSTPDESALASQAGWAGANEAVAPYLGDWRATPAQILAAAVGGYNRSRYAAQQDIAAQRRAEEAFGLQKQQFEAERAAAQEKRDAAAKQRAALEAGIANLPPELQEKAKLALAAGETDALMEMIAPKPQEMKVIGNTLFDPNTREAVFTAPQEGPTPYQRMQYGLDLAKFEWDKAHPGANDPPVAIVGPDGKSLYVPRSQSYGHQPADTREMAGTEGEREDKRMLDIAGRVALGGWAVISPEDQAWYGMKYTERAAPKFGLDIASGLVMQTTPDMSRFPVPASGQPAAQAGQQPEPVTQPVLGDREANRPAPGGHTIMNKAGAQESVPTVDNGPPSPAAAPAVTYGPPAGQAPASGMATRDQVKAFNDAVTVKNDIMVGINKVRDVLNKTGGYGALAGENKKVMDLAIRDIVTQLGKAGNSGVLAPSEVESFKAMIGDPTSLTGFFSNAVNLNPIAPALDFLEQKVTSGIENRGKEIGRDVIPEPSQRVKDQVYVTPRGPMRWTGTGWLPVTGE